MANFRDGPFSGSSLEVNSKIYVFSPSLAEKQSVATNGAQDWEAFVIGGTTYLAVAQYAHFPRNPATTFGQPGMREKQGPTRVLGTERLYQCISDSQE